MSFLIASIIILAISLSVSYISQKKFEYTLPLTMAAISAVLYITSFFNLRRIGILGIVVISVFVFGYSIYTRIKTGRKIINTLQSSGLIFIILILVAISGLAHGFMFGTSNWDEYSHWALILKNLLISSDFGNLDGSTALFKYYPQGISLFQNFITSFSNHFSEGSALAGILALSYAQMIAIFTNIKYYDWKKIIIISLMIFITPVIFFENFYYSICVDAVMALIFANIMFFYHSYQKRDLFYAIYMIMQFYLLVNTKQIGIVFALIAFIAIIIDLISSDDSKSIALFLNRTRNKLIFYVLPIISGCITYISWKIYLIGHSIKEGFSSPTLSDLLNIFSPNAPYYFTTTKTNFTHHFFNLKQYGVLNFSFFLWSIILMIALYCTYLFRLNNKGKKYYSFQMIIAIGSYMYLGVIFIMYLTAFTQNESTNVASFDRYIGTYFLSLFALTLLLLVDLIIKSKPIGKYFSPNFKLVSLAFIVFCLVPTNYLVDNTILQKYSNIARRTSRLPYEDMRKYENILDKERDRVFIISQNTSGLDYYILRYNFTPIQTQASSQVPDTWSWSLGKPYSSQDEWTVNLSVGQWSQILKNYAYVYLFHIDSQFITDYGQIFENSNEVIDRTMYRVDKIDKVIVLKRVILDSNSK